MDWDDEPDIYDTDDYWNDNLDLEDDCQGIYDIEDDYQDIYDIEERWRGWRGFYGRQDDSQDLIKKAEKFESKELQTIIVNREQLIKLDKLLNEAYVIRRPNPSDYEHRRQVIRVLNNIAKDLYGNSASCPVIEEFGSFLMDLFTAESDLDLSINFKNGFSVFSRDQKIKTLWKFANKLYSLQSAGRVQKVEPVMRAKVPIVKFVDTATGVECDISVQNSDGTSKSYFMRFITSIDERFQKLCFLMKAWAKAHDINNPKDGTLNSLSIILLVAFHLQTRDPPILPPFSAMLKDGNDQASLKNSVRNFQNYGKRNTETLGELFISFFIKLSSVKDLWSKGLCASPYLGKWTSKTFDYKIATMSVEDFMDRSQNAARTVGYSEVQKIRNCISLTLENLRLFMNFHTGQLKLKESLFGVASTRQLVNGQLGWSGPRWTQGSGEGASTGTWSREMHTTIDHLGRRLQQRANGKSPAYGAFDWDSI